MHRLISLVTLLLPSLAFATDSIYKSVDEQGNVIYSAEPPAGAVQSEQLTVPPPPSEEDVKRAEEATRQVQEQATKLEQERKAREAEQAAAAKAAEPAPGGHTVVVPVPVPGYVDDPTRVPLRPALPAGPAPARPPVRR